MKLYFFQLLQYIPHLNLLAHTLSLHAFELLADTTFLNLALDSFLRIFKVSLVAEFYQVSGLADLTLETTEGAFDWFAITHCDLDLDRE
jgi:hypothetical protein